MPWPGPGHLGVRGLSVTMPHKEAVAGLVDRCTPGAERLGAVNCVVFGEEATVGDNTDGPGLVAALRRGAGFETAGSPLSGGGRGRRGPGSGGRVG